MRSIALSLLVLAVFAWPAAVYADEADTPTPLIWNHDFAQSPDPSSGRLERRDAYPDAVLVSPNACDPCCKQRWHFSAALYLWATAISGQAWVDGEEADVDIAFSDLAKNLEGAMMAHVEGQKGRWFVGMDLFYADLGLDADVTSRVSADLDLQETILTVEGGYRVMGPDFGTVACDPAALCCCNTALDVLAGIRYWNVEEDLRIRGPNGDVRTSDSQSWVDPFVGARFTWYASPKFTVIARGDIGGFGISDDSSELTWQLAAYGFWNVNHWFSLGIGYKALNVDRVTGSGASKSGLDLTMHGPVMAFVFRF